MTYDINNQENNPETGTQANWWEEQMVEVNGVMIPLDELKNGYMRQSDYTRKTQELSQQGNRQQEIEQEPQDNNGEARKWWIGTNVLKPELDKFEKRMEAKQNFERLLNANPDLKKFRTAIEKIAKAENKAYEDVIEENWFASKDKLKQAKERSPIGDSSFDEKPTKSIAELSDKEFAEREKTQSGNSGSQFSKERTI